MKLFSKLFCFAFISLPFIFSCGKPKCDEKTPAIAYKGFQQYRNYQGKLLDSAKIIITFKDCDGDIGLDQNETYPPFDTSSKYYYNFVLTYFEMVNGAWTEKASDFKYRLPKLAAEGQSKILEGEIGMSISPFYFNFMSPNSDTIKYHVQLYDRALNESNVIETPMILTK